MKVLVTGANGFVASNLYPMLTASGHQTFALIHKHQDAIPHYVQTLKLDDLSEHYFDVVINLAGAGIADKRWTAKRQQTLYNSRVTFTQQLFKALTNKPKVLLSASAVGYYGFDDHKTFTEDTPPNPGFTHDLCSAWEKEAETFAQAGVRTAIFRLGVVLGDGGALAKMKWAYKLGMGGKIASGAQFFPWVHVHDVCRFLVTAMDEERFRGHYNLVAPHSITQAEFAKSYGRALRRPTPFTTPAFVLEGLLGSMSTLLTQGQNVVPKALLEQGFNFEYTNIDAALQSLS